MASVPCWMVALLHLRMMHGMSRSSSGSKYVMFVSGGQFILAGWCRVHSLMLAVSRKHSCCCGVVGVLYSIMLACAS